MRYHAGFSMIETVTTLAVLSVLASLAIPVLAKAQLTSMATESAVIVDGIVETAVAYEAAEGTLPILTTHPNRTLDRHAVAWLPAPAGWEEIGYEPDGAVRGMYGVIDAFVVMDAGVGMLAVGQMNLDGDDVVAARIGMFDGSPSMWGEIVCFQASGGTVPGPCL